MSYFSRITNTIGGPIGYISGVTDLAVSTAAPGMVYSTSGQQGGTLGRDATQGLGVSLSVADVSTSGCHAEAGLQFVILQGVPYLVRYGDDPGLMAYSLGTGINLGVASTGSALAFDCLSRGASGDLFFTSDLQSSGIKTWLRIASGTVSWIETILPAGATIGYDVMDLQVLSRADGDYLVTISATSNSISLYKIGANNQASLNWCIPLARTMPCLGQVGLPRSRCLN